MRSKREKELKCWIITCISHSRNFDCYEWSNRMSERAYSNCWIISFAVVCMIEMVTRIYLFEYMLFNKLGIHHLWLKWNCESKTDSILCKVFERGTNQLWHQLDIVDIVIVYWFLLTYSPIFNLSLFLWCDIRALLFFRVIRNKMTI